MTVVPYYFQQGFLLGFTRAAQDTAASNKKQSALEKAKHWKWEEIPIQKNFKGTSISGPTSIVDDDLETPYDFFSLFFTDELINHIVRETNRYAQEKI